MRNYVRLLLVVVVLLVPLAIDTGAHLKEKPAKGDVIFQRYGDTYVLKTLWEGGLGVTLVETYAEKATKAKGGTPTEHPVTATPKGKN